MEDAARLSAHLVEDVSGVETFKAFRAEGARTEEGEERLVRLSQSVFSLQKIGITTEAASTFLTAIAGVVILWYGGHRVMDGKLTIGGLVFFNSLLGYLLGPLQSLAFVNLRVQDALVAVDRLYQIMDLELEEAGEERKIEFRGLREAIEFEAVSFRYGCRGNALEQLSLRIPAGQIVAIVGESGSGKSTFLKLLMGFYFPTEGRILIDGINIRDLSLSSLRDRIALVSQDPFIFNGTVRENIALGRPGAPLEQVIEAARAAGLDEFITGLPERYETMIGERGANLSGGQRQRLAIARALLRQPEVLILDEATSHLDTATEQVVQENLRSALAGKTVILVAHRLSTIKDADLIYVLDKGRIAEHGVHRELLERRGWYGAVWLSQTDGQSSRLKQLRAAPRNGTGSKAHMQGVSHG
jgi:ATP-binding cassette subfamily B protein